MSGERVIKVQTRRLVVNDLAEQLTRAAAAVARLALKQIPVGTGLVDRVGCIVHGYHVQVKGVVAVVEGPRAVASLVFIGFGPVSVESDLLVITPLR